MIILLTGLKLNQARRDFAVLQCSCCVCWRHRHANAWYGASNFREFFMHVRLLVINIVGNSEQELRWSKAAVGFAYKHPHLYVYSENAVEVRNNTYKIYIYIYVEI